MRKLMVLALVALALVGGALRPPPLTTQPT